MYFATLLKTTAPVKLPISQLSLSKFYSDRKVNMNPTSVIRFSILCLIDFPILWLLKYEGNKCDD